ncbi:unnamed protein product [Parascedosporium putredinis]|uniref:TauD/TfdA-like domain-containing protein n=1 Tax=Parascedosporium putredinis TaxID=1442378 RepID=A0A9P1GVX0_9PEZI|nr:unnamed protein product [Parascedosporium putredinis]CAI7988021.1 unnamed protein product [Parascedosporium putredinis]
MAPGILVDDTYPSPINHVVLSKNEDAPRSIFPDGIRTSGQHPPLYDTLKPYSEFPKEITGPTVWRKEDYENNPERWTRPFTDQEVEELGRAADNFINSGTALTGISKALFPLPVLGKVLATLREDLLNVAYMGLGTHLGYFLSQNGRGHVLGHVKDVGDDPTQIHKGGESDIVSFHNVWNTLVRENADVAELLTKPVWYFDRKGEVSTGQEEWTRQPIAYLENGGKNRVYVKWDPYYVRSLKRFSDEGLIPALSPEQERAALILEETANRLALHMVLEVGDIQFLSNAHLLHARTQYKGEGGWALPMPDSAQAKRGGIQVNDTAPSAPLDAE